MCPRAKTSAMAVTSSSFRIGSDHRTLSKARDLCCTSRMFLEAVGRSAAAHKSPDRYPYCTASVGKKRPNMQSCLCSHRGSWLFQDVLVLKKLKIALEHTGTLLYSLSRHDSVPFADSFFGVSLYTSSLLISSSPRLVVAWFSDRARTLEKYHRITMLISQFALANLFQSNEYHGG